jgi:hypothetical protein
MKKRKYYMVKRGHTKRTFNPTYVHFDARDAYEQAQTLAHKHPNKTFYILEAIGFVRFRPELVIEGPTHAD